MFLGIDPGRCKCGWALVFDDGRLMASGILETSGAREFLGIMTDGDGEKAAAFALYGAKSLPSRFNVKEFLIGDGTGKDFFLSLAKELSLRVKLVPEKETTLKGRKLYWDYNPPAGFRRLIPQGLRVPPRDIDDFAALAIAREFLKSKQA